MASTCIYGHALIEGNLTTNGRCRTCHNDTQRRSHARKPKVSQYIPAQPLAELLHRRAKHYEDGVRGLAIHIAAQLRTEDWETIETKIWEISHRKTILRATADRLIIALELHPSIVYDYKIWEALPGNRERKRQVC